VLVRSPFLILLAALLAGSCASIPAGQLEGGAASADVPTRFVGGHVFLPVLLDGAGPVWMLLDTGANDSA